MVGGMALGDDFAAAQVRIKQLTKAPDASELLELYALFKQGTLGDVTGERPGMLAVADRGRLGDLEDEILREAGARGELLLDRLDQGRLDQ